jgi:hypothetical protein
MPVVCPVKAGKAAVVALLLLLAMPAHALLVSLDAYVDFPITGPDGVTPIADGSWVFIYGSGDAVQDPQQTFGTNIIAGTTTGDDIILGAIQIPLNVGTNNSGMFFTTVEYESDDINYTYIRFFDTPGQLTGTLFWGTSDMYQLGITLGVATVQYDPGTNLIANQTNNFVIIPEPSTANLFVVVAGMLWAMRVHRRFVKKRDEDDSDEDGDDDRSPAKAPLPDLQAVPSPVLNAPTDFSGIYRPRAGPPDPHL